jgi:hypothetical protein
MKLAHLRKDKELGDGGGGESVIPAQLVHVVGEEQHDGGCAGGSAPRRRCLQPPLAAVPAAVHIHQNPRGARSMARCQVKRRTEASALERDVAYI